MKNREENRLNRKLLLKNLDNYSDIQDAIEKQDCHRLISIIAERDD